MDGLFNKSNPETAHIDVMVLGGKDNPSMSVRQESFDLARARLLVSYEPDPCHRFCHSKTRTVR